MVWSGHCWCDQTSICWKLSDHTVWCDHFTCFFLMRQHHHHTWREACLQPWTWQSHCLSSIVEQLPSNHTQKPAAKPNPRTTSSILLPLVLVNKSAGDWWWWWSLLFVRKGLCRLKGKTKGFIDEVFKGGSIWGRYLWSKKKGKICFVIYIAGERKYFVFIYEVVVKQKKRKRSANHYFHTNKMLFRSWWWCLFNTRWKCIQCLTCGYNLYLSQSSRGGGIGHAYFCARPLRSHFKKNAFSPPNLK